ncbi:MAG: alginate export family protein [Acidobacteriota bacterium]|nr:alginate export family protein [Blastocatellia bacterium]MDW8411467.1 alginate export family protein [Acidobacteriota bacterium]
MRYFILLLLLFACPSYGQQKDADLSIASEINKHLPEWIRVGGEYRFRAEGFSGIRGKEGANDLYYLSRVRLDLTLKLSKRWKIFLQGQDAHVFGFVGRPIPLIHQDAMDLRQAYIEWRQKDKGGFTFKLGRQELNYGDQRLLGSLNWTNTARSFDAVKMAYSNDKVAVDLFAASVVKIQDSVFDKHGDGNNLYGAYVQLPKTVKSATWNNYFFYKTERPMVRSEDGRLGTTSLYTVGTNLVGKFSPRIGYEIDLMLQRGSFSNDSIRAYAIHTKLYRELSSKETVPTVFVEYNVASGDERPGDGIRGTFDQLFPTGHVRYGLMDQVGLKNMHNVWLGTVWKPHKKLKLQFDYHSLWLYSRRDGLYNAGGALVARIPDGSAPRHIAHEVDLRVTYDFNKYIQLEGGYGHWIPGGFWKKATPGSSQSFGYTMLTYKF